MSEQIPIEQFNEAMLDGKLTTLELVRLAKLTTCVQLAEVVMDKIAEVEESGDYLSQEYKIEAMKEILNAIASNQRAMARTSIVDGHFVYEEREAEFERGDSTELREARRKVEKVFSAFKGSLTWGPRDTFNNWAAQFATADYFIGDIAVSVTIGLFQDSEVMSLRTNGAEFSSFQNLAELINRAGVWGIGTDVDHKTCEIEFVTHIPIESLNTDLLQQVLTGLIHCSKINRAAN